MRRGIGIKWLGVFASTLIMLNAARGKLWDPNAPGDSGAPCCELLSPASGARVGGVFECEVSFEAKGEEDGVVKEVAVLLDEETVVGTTKIIPPAKEGTATVSADVTGIADGPHTLTAAARQGAHVGWSSPVSVVIDNHPPQPIDLQAGIAVSDALSVRWLAVGDVQPDGSVVPVSSMEARWSLTAFDEGTWEEAQVISPELLPEIGTPGEPQELVLTELLNGTTYYVGIRIWDEAGNASFANVVELTTSGSVTALYGDITEPTTLNEGTYWVTDALVVKPRARLVCGPDVVLKMNQRASITVERGGRGIFLGAPEHSVVVTSENDDTQGEVLPGSTGEPLPGDYVSGLDLTIDSRVKFLTVAYAGEFAIRAPAGTDLREIEIGYPAETGMVVTPGDETVPGQTIENAFIHNAPQGVLVQSQASETLQWVTLWDCTVAVGIASNAEAVIKECIFAHCPTGVGLEDGTASVAGARNGFFDVADGVLPEAQGTDLEESLVLGQEETPFAMDAQGEEMPGVLSDTSPFLDYGLAYASEKGYLGHTTRKPPVEGSNGRFFDFGMQDLGYHWPVDSEARYFIHEGAIETREVFQGGWTVVVTPLFVGIPAGLPEGTDAALVLEPGCVVKIADTAALPAQALQTVASALAREGTSWLDHPDPEEILRMMKEAPGITVGFKELPTEEDPQATRSLLSLESEEEPPEEWNPDNYGSLSSVGEPGNLVAITTVYDDEVGVDTDKSDGTEPWDERDMGYASEGNVEPFHVIGFSYMGEGSSSRIEHTEIRFAIQGLFMMQKIGSAIKNNRFLNCGIGVLDFDGSMEDAWGNPQIVRNNLFSNPMTHPEPQGIGIWSRSRFDLPGGLIQSNTFDQLGIGVMAKDVFANQEVKPTSAQIESNLFTDCGTAISTINTGLYAHILGNGFWDVGEVIDRGQQSATWFEDGANLALDATPYTVDHYLNQDLPSVTIGDVHHMALASGMGCMTTDEGHLVLDKEMLDLGYHRALEQGLEGRASGLSGKAWPGWLAANWKMPGTEWEEITFNVETLMTTLRDEEAEWTPAALAGLTVQPNTQRKREFLIKDNTETTLLVYGDVTGVWLGEDPIAEACLDGQENSDHYEIHDDRLAGGAVAIDQGTDEHVLPSDVDIDGAARMLDGNEDGVAKPDLGAHEVAGVPEGIMYVPKAVPLPLSVLYVDGSIPESGNGSSWAEAVNSIGEALAMAETLPAPVRILVARGTYPENVPLPEGGQLFGGFAGTETTVDERDPDLIHTQNATTLQGDGTGSVVTLASLSLIDGFMVTGGTGTQGTLAGEDVTFGGGIAAMGSETDPLNDVVVRSCIVEGNSVNGTLAMGGGISFAYVQEGEILNCVVCENESAHEGGGLCIYGGTASVAGCHIHGNESETGGGATLKGTGEGTLFQGNSVTCNWATGAGGGLHIEGDTACQVDRCEIAGNAALSGAGVYAEGSAGLVEVTSSWIVGNVASYSGGGITFSGNVRTVSNMVIGNGAPHGGALVLDEYTGETLNHTVARNESNPRSGAVLLQGEGTGLLENNLFLDNAGYTVFESNETSDALVRYNGLYTEEGKVYVDEGGIEIDTITALNALPEAEENIELVPEFASVVVSGDALVQLSYSTEGYVTQIGEAGSTTVELGGSSQWSATVPDDGQTYYVTLWASTDGGQTWHESDQTQLASIDLEPPGQPVILSVTPQANGWVGPDVQMTGTCSRDTMILEMEIEDFQGNVTSRQFNKESATTWTRHTDLFPLDNEVRIYALDAALNRSLLQNPYHYLSDHEPPWLEIIVPGALAGSGVQP